MLSSMATDAPVEVAPPAPPCPHGEAPEGILDLFPGLPDTQIHPAVAADGDGAWIAFDVPAATGRATSRRGPRASGATAT